MEGFLSIAFRLLVNLESLNSVETVGNLVRHRTAPIITGQNGSYSIRFVPAISGESLAHAYQSYLVEEAKKRKLPLSSYSERGEFLKFTDDKLIKEAGISIPKNEMEIRSAEVQVMLKDYVCDVGGFLYAGAYPIKRTSTFQVGYMLPAVFETEAAALESQFQVRYASSSMKQYQQPYNVEVGSAVYTFTFNLDISRISVPSTEFGDKNQEEENKLAKQRDARVVGALSALAQFLTQFQCGAKRSRFLPNIEPLSAIAAYSPNTSFIVCPGNSKKFIGESVKRAQTFSTIMKKLQNNVTISTLAFDKEDAAEGVEGVEITKTPEDFVSKLLDMPIKKG